MDLEELDVLCKQMKAWVAGWVQEEEELRRGVMERIRDKCEHVRNLCLGDSSAETGPYV